MCGSPRSCVSSHLVCLCPLAMINSSWMCFPEVWEPVLQVFLSAGRWLHHLIVMKNPFFPYHDLLYMVLIPTGISWSFISISDIEKSTDNAILSIYTLLQSSLGLKGPTIPLKANGTWESNSCKLDLRKHQGTEKKICKRNQRNIFVLFQINKGKKENTWVIAMLPKPPSSTAIITCLFSSQTHVFKFAKFTPG